MYYLYIYIRKHPGRRKCFQDVNSHLDLKQKFETIVEENQRWLVHYVNSIVNNIYTAQDIVQEVFVRAYKSYNDYDEKGKIRQWLRTIARNAAIRHIYGKSRNICLSLGSPVNAQEDSLLLSDILYDMDLSPDEKSAWSELKTQILNAINKLPDEQKQVVYMRYVQNHSINHVANITRQPVGSVKSKSRYGLEKVKRNLLIYLMEGEYIMNCKEAYAFLFQYAKGKIMPEDKTKV